MKSKDFDQAIEWEEKALLADPNLGIAHKALGQIYLDEKNDKKKAYFHFQKYLNLEPSSQDRDQIQKIVEKLKKGL